MADLSTNVPHDDKALQKLTAIIPAFTGYHEREARRRADKMLNDHLMALLDQIRQRIHRFQAELKARGEFKPVTDLDRVSRRLKRARERVEHAHFAYAGFLDVAEIEAAAADRLYDYDLAIEQHLAAIDAAAEAITGAAPEQYDEAIAAMTETLEELSRLIDERSEIAADLTP